MKTRGLMGKQPTNMVILMGFVYVMWVKHCHKPPMTGNIWEWFIPYTTYKNGDDWGMFFFLIRIIHVFNLVIWQTFGASTWGNFQLHSTFLLRILFLWWLSFATPYLSVYLYIYIYGYGSIPINTIFSGMNIHLPAILMFTRGTRFWPTAIYINYIIYPHQPTWCEASSTRIFRFSDPLPAQIRDSPNMFFSRCSDINIGRNDSQFEGFQNTGYPKTDGLKWKILWKWMI